MARQPIRASSAESMASKAAAQKAAARPPAEQEPTAATVGAESIAVGEDTYATGSASLNMVDKGRVTSVRGEATATATAEGGNTFVAADTYAQVEGADFVVVRTMRTSGAESETSTTKVFAISIDGWAPDGGPVYVNNEHTRPNHSSDPRIDGNIAIASARASAYGDGTLTFTQSDSFTTDGLSTAYADAFGLIG